MIADRRALNQLTTVATRRGVLAACVALLCVAGAGLPEDGSGQDLQRSPPTALSLQEAIEIATRRRPGRVVRAVTVESGGRRVHEVRILSEEGGRVVTVRVDAQTGRTR